MKIENIKFKAKCLDGKGWAIGDLLHSYKNGTIIVPIEGGGAFSVDPSTIIQFTGMKDGEGKEIWEGDLIIDEYTNIIYEVKWVENRVAYIAFRTDKHDDYPPYLGWYVSNYYLVVLHSKYDKEKQRMNIANLYLIMNFIYILLVCLDGEDIKPKWKQWLVDKLGIKPKIEVRYIKPQVIKLRSRVAILNFEMQYYGRDKSDMEQLKRRIIESVYDSILQEMKANGLITISQYKDIYNGNTIYEGTCSIYKN